MNQATLVMIKPDCIRRKMAGQVITSIESHGLSITGLHQKTLTKKEANELYKEHKGKWHFHRNIRHITSGPVIVIKVEGDDVVQICRQIVENYRHAHQDVVQLPKNLVHATADPEKTLEELEAVGCCCDSILIHD